MIRRDSNQPPEVLCFGMITPARALVVDSLPAWNTGAVWTDGAEFVSDDAAIVSGLLSRWGTRTELAGNALGDDDAGRRTVQMLRDMGVEGRFELRAGLQTPFEINISDRARGGRTYLWNRRADVLATLDDADLSALANAKLLYADWYDSPYIVRAMKASKSLGVPVMLNLEHGHTSPETLDALLPYATICQAVTDAAQLDRRHRGRGGLGAPSGESRRGEDGAGDDGVGRRGGRGEAARHSTSPRPPRKLLTFAARGLRFPQCT